MHPEILRFFVDLYNRALVIDVYTMMNGAEEATLNVVATEAFPKFSPPVVQILNSDFGGPVSSKFDFSGSEYILSSFLLNCWLDLNEEHNVH